MKYITRQKTGENPQMLFSGYRPCCLSDFMVECEDADER